MTAKIRKVGQSAYFIPSYSEQTIISYQPTLSNQTVTFNEVGVEDEVSQTNIENDNTFTRHDFEKALKRASRKIKR